MGQPALPGRRTGAAMALVVIASALAGCGSSADDGARPSVTLLLDFTPNAVHAGIYRATARGYDRDADVRLRVREPGQSSDSVKLLAAGRTDLAILDIHDLGLAREKGADVVGVMALVQRPLAAVIAQPQIRSPRDLQGRRAGVTGVPSDDAVLSSEVRGDGGDPRRVHRVTIGFNAVASLLSRRVDGATAFWNAEGVAISRRRPDFHVFRVDAFGAPAYPELVLCTTRRALRAHPGRIRAALRAVRHGYEQTLTDPAGSVRDLTRAVPGLDRGLTAAELKVLLPVLRAPGRPYGELDPARLRVWAAWDVRFGILRHRPNIARAFDPSIARASR